MEKFPTARSDQLEAFRRFLSKSPFLPYLSSIVSVSLIVDANVAYRAILWMAKTRRNPEAEPEFIELAKTGLVTYHAPTFLIEEICKYLPKIAETAKKPLTEVERLWDEIKSYIRFFDTEKLPKITDGRENIDPKDVPYLQLQEHLGLAILTQDPHLQKMGASVVSFVVTTRLKDLYRTNAIEYQLAAGGHVFLTVTTRTLSSLIQKIREGFSLLTNAPVWVYVGIAILLIVVLRNPQNRARITVLIDNFLENAPAVIEEVGKLLKRATTPYSQAKLKAAEIAAELPASITQPVSNPTQQHT